MDITDYIPNIFGAATPSSYENLQTMGLISPQQVAQQQKTANIQGLLGAGLALAQGMSRTGPRRSAAENILGALSGGFGAASGAYQQGIQNVVQQQQLQSAALQQQQALNKIESLKAAKLANPDIAYLADIDPGKFAEEVALRQRLKGIELPTAGGQQQSPEGLRAIAQRYYAAGPNFKALGDSYMEQAKRLELGGLADITGKETPDQLFALSRKAAAAGNKELADQFATLAEQKRLQPPQVTVAQPTAVQPAPEQQVQMPSGPGVTAQGQPFVGVPNYAAGERYVDEAMHQKALEQQRTLPPTVVQASGKIGQLQSGINNIDAELARVQGLPLTEGNTKYQSNLRLRREILVKDIDRYSVMEYDFTDLKSLPNKYQAEVKQLQKQAEGGTLDSAGLNSRIEKLYTRLQEDEKGRSLTGNTAVFAQMKFGVTDRTQLSGPQLAEILRFENAPTADQLAQLQRESQKLQFETGRGSPIPVGREQMLGGTYQPSKQVTPQVQPQVSPTTTQQVTPTVTRPTVSTAAPQVATTTTTQAAPARTSTVIDQKIAQNPLISRPDSEVPPKKKQELIQAQPGLIASTNYTVKNIVDARNAAQSLLDNPKYLDALSGRTAPLRSQTIGGIVLDQDAYTANEILNNLLGRSFISEIQEMRANSPTGGAVGNVAVAEMNSLSKIRAAITLGMDKTELKKQLESYVANANRAMKTIPNDYARTYGYKGEFDDLLSSEVVSPKPTSGKTAVELELERRKGRKP